VPTAPSGTNSTQIANTAFVKTEISNLVNSAPSTLDTLNELAIALGNDANFSTTITNLIANKVSKSGDIMTGTLQAPSGFFTNSINIGGWWSQIGWDGSNFFINSAVPLSITSDDIFTIQGYSSIEMNTPVNISFNTGAGEVVSWNGNTLSVEGHTHTSSNITNFNSSVSGLLPVKNIVGGSGINVSSLSGTYTVAVTGIAGLISEEVDDRVSQLLVEGTGVNLTYNDASGTLTIDNLHTEINELSLEPQGFVNRLDSVISFNDSTRTFTIAPSGSSYDIYIEGVKVTKTTSESIIIPTGTALNYLHFNTDTGLLDNKTTGFNFDTDVPIAYIHWNSSINQSTFFGEERHGIRMDSMTHKWIHNTFGMQYINGLSIGGYILLGNGSSNSHAQIDISDGTLYQEDIIINIADGDNGIEFTQQLNPIAYIPVYYHLGTTGQWVRDVSTPYPLKYNATRAQYNLLSGETWTIPNVTNNRYFAMWIVATNDINDPILAIMGQREDSSLGSAENNNTWSDIDLTNIPTNEIRPLYRLIFITNGTFTNTPKSSLQSILDLRKSIITSTYGVSQNDHGNLFGLGDDDHFQYVHINEPRTITANHTLSNGLTISSGLLSATSGNFTSLNVNGSGVSLNGHTHTGNDLLIEPDDYIVNNTTLYKGSNSAQFLSQLNLDGIGEAIDVVGGIYAINIMDFNSSVSGLFPSNIVTGLGSSGYLTKWIGAGSVGSGIIYDDGTNIGLGTISPSGLLDVAGNLTFNTFTEKVITNTNSGSGVVLSIDSGTVHRITLTNNCNFTMPSVVAGKSFSLFLNSGSGNYTASFSGVLWSDSATPTITTTANKVDILSFISDGSYWYGSYSQNYG
jgi:hypothetical protein